MTDELHAGMQAVGAPQGVQSTQSELQCRLLEVISFPECMEGEC